MNKILYDNNLIYEIKNIFSYKFSKNIAVAVSGGLDSMVLINLLLKYVSKSILEVIHCNFNLRGIESYKDEMFVKNFCKNKNIIFNVKRFKKLSTYSKKQGVSIQMYARKLRYNWFNELLNKKSYKYIVLGHHLDDSIETFFINILRGTGLPGLLGIPKKNGKFIRPLSNFRKEDILNYAKLNNIEWRIDKSNYNTKYLRNKIRIHLSSIIKQLNCFYKGFKKTINLLYEENSLIKHIIKEIINNITIDKKINPFFWKIDNKKLLEFKTLPLSVILFRLFNPYGFSDIESLKRFINAQSGKQILSKKYRIIKNQNFWILVSNFDFLKNKKKVFKINNNYELENYNKKLPIKIKFINNYNNKNKKINKKIIYLINFEKIKFPILLRTWDKGDYFYPYGVKGKQKLSKFFKNEKLSLFEKENIWLLINGNGYIILIIGYRLDKRFKIIKKTNKILCVEYKR